MNGLPHDKRPLTGEPGAQYRKKQLMRQLPSHDQNPDECHDLSEAEKREMEVFVKHYRERALGVARVAENDKLTVGGVNKLAQELAWRIFTFL